MEKEIITEMNWLQGGPYYELSFLINNSEDKESLLRTILSFLKKESTFYVINSNEELENKIGEYVRGYIDEDVIQRNLDINSILQISGLRKSRLNISELSEELVKVNFWFYGSIYNVKEWNQKGLQKNDKPVFKEFFKSMRKLLNPLLGTIAYEKDCQDLFLTEELSPNKIYSIRNLSIKNIIEIVNRNVNDFELCWVNGEIFGQKESFEIEIKTA